jgi:hypothetical protein
MDLAEFHKYHFRVTRVAAHLLGGPQPATDSSAGSSASATSAGASSVRPSPVAAAVQDLSKDAAWAAEPWGDRHAELKHVGWSDVEGNHQPRNMSNNITAITNHFLRQKPKQITSTIAVPSS